MVWPVAFRESLASLGKASTKDPYPPVGLCCSEGLLGAGEAHRSLALQGGFPGSFFLLGPEGGAGGGCARPLGQGAGGRASRVKRARIVEAGNLVWGCQIVKSLV